MSMRAATAADDASWPACKVELTFAGFCLAFVAAPALLRGLAGEMVGAQMQVSLALVWNSQRAVRVGCAGCSELCLLLLVLEPVPSWDSAMRRSHSLTMPLEAAVAMRGTEAESAAITRQVSCL